MTVIKAGNFKLKIAALCLAAALLSMTGCSDLIRHAVGGPDKKISDSDSGGDSVPENYQSPYDGAQGSAGSLSGRTLIVSIFTDDAGTSWDWDLSEDNEMIYDTLDNLRISTDYLSEQAANFGASAEFIYDWEMNPDICIKAEFDESLVTEFGDMYDVQKNWIDNNVDTQALRNKYLADTEPWKLAKTDMNRTATVLHIALQIAANLAIAFEPFLPFSSQKLKTMLQLDASIGWDDLGRIDLLPEGQALGEVSLLFEKIEDAAIQAQLDKLAHIKQENEKAAQEEALKNWRPEPVKEPNSFDEFEKNDIRVGTVLECTNVKKSERLLQFRIDDGMGGRTILSGIAQSYPDPSVLVGKQVLFIANFPPRKMMGIESQGMILSAVDADGKLVVTTVSAPVKNGAQVG